MSATLLKELTDEMKSLAHELRQRVDTLDSEQKSLREDITSKTGAMPAEYKSGIDRLNARLNELTDKIEAAQVEAARPPMGERDGKKNAAGRAAFLKALRKRGNLSYLSEEEKSYIVPDFMPAERKALYAGDAAEGGFFATTDFVDEIQAYKLLISPVRQIARKMTTSGEKVQMPALATDTNAYWAVEQQNFQDSLNATVSMLNIPVHELRGLLKISQQNLEDSMFNLEDFIKERLTLQFAQTEGRAFINGTGNGMPRGLLSYNIKASASYGAGGAGKANVVDAIPYVPSGNASAITADSILNILMDLKSYYVPNATWCFSRGTLNQIRLFKDGQNRPLWQPFAAGGLPSTIYDRPYIEMPDMPEVSANTYPVILGDFSHYLIVDRVTLNMQQLNELFAIQGLVAYIARQRTGGDILLPEAFRVMKVAVS
jgi:HK97 family phage major capsid protein